MGRCLFKAMCLTGAQNHSTCFTLRTPQGTPHQMTGRISWITEAVGSDLVLPLMPNSRGARRRLCHELKENRWRLYFEYKPLFLRGDRLSQAFNHGTYYGLGPWLHVVCWSMISSQCISACLCVRACVCVCVSLSIFWLPMKAPLLHLQPQASVGCYKGSALGLTWLCIFFI